eukprot:CAMPEP_0168536782 /NCGR_PEP_ID=MMETSP0405-20121227/19827_1 /TAXON_ID=498012 /ORGANISM="Trichosphaerium sp, Strain Am-I-7 wt" /LENGTH=184 /DNA_ID=CAMNT_0008564999 /DNA_START=39 /DNA_END=593 /DNA_ORIENTATION=-
MSENNGSAATPQTGNEKLAGLVKGLISSNPISTTVWLEMVAKYKRLPDKVVNGQKPVKDRGTTDLHKIVLEDDYDRKRDTVSGVVFERQKIGVEFKTALNHAVSLLFTEQAKLYGEFLLGADVTPKHVKKALNNGYIYELRDEWVPIAYGKVKYFEFNNWVWRIVPRKPAAQTVTFVGRSIKEV